MPDTTSRGLSDDDLHAELSHAQRESLARRVAHELAPLGLEDESKSAGRSLAELEAAEAGKKVQLERFRNLRRDLMAIEAAGGHSETGPSVETVSLAIEQVNRELQSIQRALNRARVAATADATVEAARSAYELVEMDPTKSPYERTVAKLAYFQVQAANGRNVRSAILDIRAHLARLTDG